MHTKKVIAGQKIGRGRRNEGKFPFPQIRFCPPKLITLMAARTCFRARAPVSHPSPQTPEPPSFVLRVFRSRARLVPLFCACVRRSCCVFRIAQYLPMFDLLFFPPTFPFFFFGFQYYLRTFVSCLFCSSPTFAQP